MTSHETFTFAARQTAGGRLIEIEGESFASLLLHLALHTENLRRAVKVLRVVNASDRDEPLSELTNMLQAMANSMFDCTKECSRIAAAQELLCDVESQLVRPS